MRRAELARLALVAAVAALVFRLAIALTLEPTDEGQIVYPAWLTARGAVPYRDFLQLYGPSLFWLNGALLAVFGATLWPVRLGLVAVKVAVVVLTYAAARQVAGPALALAVAAFATAVWGVPIWLFNAPYANHYATVGLLAALLLLGAARGRLAVLALAGVCLGLAATFKQTTGVLLFIGLGLALLRAGERRPAAPAPAPPAPPLARRGAALVCAAFLVASAALVAFYLHAGTLRNGLVLALPLGALWALAAAHWRGADRPRAAAALLALAAGLALPLVASAAWFAAAGALGDLVWNTLYGLPQLVRWYTPLRAPGSGAGWLLAVALLGCAASMPGATGIGRRAVAWLAAAAAVGLIVWAAATGRTRGQVTFVTAFLPFAVAAAGVWVTRRAGAAADARLPLLAATGLAAASLLLLFPAADIYHQLMGLPLCLPLLAGLLARWTAGRPLRHAAAVAALLLLALPFAAQLWRARAAPPLPGDQARAAGMRLADPSLRDLPALLDALAEFAPERPLFVAANHQLLYLLAGRDSPLAREEYLLYLAYPGAIDAADARRVLREDDAVARLTAARPIVVLADGRDGQRLRAVYPAIGRLFDERTAPRQRVGRYEIRDWQP